jgi:hypothetical protein
MPLATGSRPGPCEIVGPLGAGGMSACGRGERVPRIEPLRVGVGPHVHKEKQTPSPCH